MFILQGLLQYLEFDLFTFFNQLYGAGLVLIFGLFISTAALATTDTDSLKNELEIKSGSMLGLIHLSYGRIVADRHHFSLGVGYVPELSNHRELMLFSLVYRYQGVTSFNLEQLGLDATLSPINFGITNIIANNSNLYTKIKQPDQVPDGYYYPTGRHILLNYQIALQLNKTYEYEVYSDFSILDIGLINYIRNFDFYKDNYNFIGLDGIVNYGFGVRMKF